MGKRGLTPLEKEAMKKFGYKSYSKQRLLGAEIKGWRSSKKLWK